VTSAILEVHIKDTKRDWITALCPVLVSSKNFYLL